MKRGIGILLLFILGITSFAQNKSNRGKEFWLGYGFHWIALNPDAAIGLNTQELALYISSENATTVTVSINGTSWSQTLNIPANTVDASILIPKTGVNDARILSEGLSNRAIHIVSTEPVAVYAHMYVSQGSGATMLMPVETYGYSYYSVNFSQNTSSSPLPALSATTANGPDWYSWFYVVASEDNTRLNITPSDTTMNGWLPGQTYTVNLNKGEIYNVFGKMVPNNNSAWAASKDMTGSKVIAVPGNDGNCHPFALFSGSSGIRICRGDGGESMQQQMFPSQAWGTRYLTYHTINNTNTDINETNRNYYRVCVSNPSTIVKRNNIPLTGLIKNFYYEFMDSTGGDYIEADKPILISQYMVNKNQCWNFPTTTPSPPSNGDPEMFYLSPIEQGQKSVRLFASRQSPAIFYVYTNIILPVAGLSSLKVDGNPVPATQIKTHPNNANYAVALVRFTGVAAQHTITSDSIFNATIYGLGNYESYGYNVGTLINNLNYYSEIVNTAKTTAVTDTFSCPHTPLKIYLKLGFPATRLHWKLSQVNGISPNADSIINNPAPIRTEIINGRSYYVYSLQQDFVFNNPGTFTIPVTYTSTVIENCSQSENATIQVVIKPGPVADFTINGSGNNCLKDSIQFTGVVNAAGFNITNYLWNFADGTTSNTINTAKKFAGAGAQLIRFRVFADNGCIADTSKNITIQPSAVASFSLQPSACEKDSVLITDNSTSASGSITSWQWTYFNVDHTFTNNAPFKIYFSQKGTYGVALIVTNSNGCKSDTTFQSIDIHSNPVSKFGYSGNICIGDSIKYSDSSSIASGSITKWNWNLGNGQTSIRNSNTAFYWPYSATGNFTASLSTESNYGCKGDTATKLITVNNKPVASIQYSGMPCVDSIITFNSSITTGPATWYWQFGNGQSSTSIASSSAQQVYTSAANNVAVKHVVSYGPGCVSDTAVSTIASIYNNPTMNIALQTDTLCVGRSILFNGNSTATNITWNWVIDGNASQQTPPFSYIFTQSKSYNVSAFVVNNGGCRSLPFSKTLTIRPLPNLSAGPDLVINPGNSIRINATLSQPSDYTITWLPGTSLNDATILNPLASPLTPTLYTIKVIDKFANCTATDQVFVNVVTKLAVPNVFSPNGDGINDEWILPGIELYPKATVSIYTRYGQKIFEKQNYHQHPWDGVNNGKPMPVGSYAYIIQLNNAAKEVLAGTILLLR